MGCVGENAKSLYSMTKGALISGCRSLAIEFAPKKIRLNVISPGLIETAINRNQPYLLDPEKRKQTEAMYPLGFGNTNDIANVSSRTASNINTLNSSVETINSSVRNINSSISTINNSINFIICWFMFCN